MASYYDITRDDASDAAEKFYRDNQGKAVEAAKPILDKAAGFLRPILKREIGEELFDSLINSNFKCIRKSGTKFGRVYMVSKSDQYHYVHFNYINFTRIDFSYIFDRIPMTEDEYKKLNNYQHELEKLLDDWQVKRELSDTIYNCRTRSRLERLFPEAVKYIKWREKPESPKKTAPRPESKASSFVKKINKI